VRCISACHGDPGGNAYSEWRYSVSRRKRRTIESPLLFHGTLFESLPERPRFHFTTHGHPQTRSLGGRDPALYGHDWDLQKQLLSPRALLLDGTKLQWEYLTMHTRKAHRLQAQHDIVFPTNTFTVVLSIVGRSLTALTELRPNFHR
jgi:hypothetical protein